MGTLGRGLLSVQEFLHPTPLRENLGIHGRGVRLLVLAREAGHGGLEVLECLAAHVRRGEPIQPPAHLLQLRRALQLGDGDAEDPGEFGEDGEAVEAALALFDLLEPALAVAEQFGAGAAAEAAPFAPVAHAPCGLVRLHARDVRTRARWPVSGRSSGPGRGRAGAEAGPRERTDRAGGSAQRGDGEHRYVCGTDAVPWAAGVPRRARAARRGAGGHLPVPPLCPHLGGPHRRTDRAVDDLSALGFIAVGREGRP